MAKMPLLLLGLDDLTVLVETAVAANAMRKLPLHRTAGKTEREGSCNLVVDATTSYECGRGPFYA